MKRTTMLLIALFVLSSAVAATVLVVQNQKSKAEVAALKEKVRQQDEILAKSKDLREAVFANASSTATLDTLSAVLTGKGIVGVPVASTTGVASTDSNSKSATAKTAVATPPALRSIWLM